MSGSHFCGGNGDLGQLWKTISCNMQTGSQVLQEPLNFQSSGLCIKLWSAQLLSLLNLGSVACKTVQNQEEHSQTCKLLVNQKNLKRRECESPERSKHLHA